MTVVRRELLDAIATVESQKNDNAVGGGGKAIGRYQITEVYIKDTNLPYSLNDMKDPNKAEAVIQAYMKRYAGVGASDEKIARIHNGGPNGYKNSSTLGYWNKVKKELGGK